MCILGIVSQLSKWHDSSSLKGMKWPSLLHLLEVILFSFVGDKPLTRDIIVFSSWIVFPQNGKHIGLIMTFSWYGHLTVELSCTKLDILYFKWNEIETFYGKFFFFFLGKSTHIFLKLLLISLSMFCKLSIVLMFFLNYQNNVNVS